MNKHTKKLRKENRIRRAATKLALSKLLGPGEEVIAKMDGYPYVKAGDRLSIVRRGSILSASPVMFQKGNATALSILDNWNCREVQARMDPGVEPPRDIVWR